MEKQIFYNYLCKLLNNDCCYNDGPDDRDICGLCDSKCHHGKNLAGKFNEECKSCECISCIKKLDDISYYDRKKVTLYNLAGDTNTSYNHNV